MLIDWLTVVAQIVNFLVLMFLLKRFLYGPILRAIDSREENVASRLREAEEKSNEAEAEIDSYRLKNRELDTSRQELLNKAVEDAERQKNELVEKARDEVESLKADWLEAFREEKDTFLQNYRKKTAKQVYDIASRVLSDLSGSDINLLVADVFTRQLRDMDSSDVEMLREKALKPGEEIIISSAFDIPDEKRRGITEALKTLIAEDINVRYAVSPDTICGVELLLNGYKMGWNLDDYLTNLEKETERLLDESMTNNLAGE